MIFIRSIIGFFTGNLRMILAAGAFGILSYAVVATIQVSNLRVDVYQLRAELASCGQRETTIREDKERDDAVDAIPGSGLVDAARKWLLRD